MQKPERMIRWPDVRHRTGLSRTTVWRKIRANEFPTPVKLTAHSIAWRESEIDEWLMNRKSAA